MTVVVRLCGFGDRMIMFQPNPEAIPFGIAVAISAGLAVLACAGVGCRSRGPSR